MDHHVDAIHVDTTRRHVGGHEHLQFPHGETLEGLLTGGLGKVPMDRRSTHVEVPEVVGYPVTHALGRAEHHDSLRGLADRRDNPVLVHVVHAEENMVHRADGVVRGVDGDLHRILQVAAHEVTDLAVQRCREQHRLVHTGDMTQDPLDLWGEAIVGHAVGLVDDDHLNLGEVHLFALDEVDEAQRRSHHEVDTLLEEGYLILAGGPAVCGEHHLAACLGDRREHLCHLKRQLTGGHEHEAVRAVGGGVRRDAAEHRYAKRERLARPGTCPATDILTGERHGDGLDLDGERLRESGLSETTIHVRGDSECSETSGGHGGSSFSHVDPAQATSQKSRWAVYRPRHEGPPYDQ
ncbi:unannotated protein [freshwater metagenome]|uniref:Unannotated protein n=1 Tax=freshwater metagenome TaxID=449393 RepID=A0A6J7D279_9ZZZZ